MRPLAVPRHEPVTRPLVFVDAGLCLRAVEVKDDIITTRVKARLKGMKGSNIVVQTNAGVVSLTGDIDTVMNSAKASWKAWTVKGVKSVRNDLTVKP